MCDTIENEKRTLSEAARLKNAYLKCYLTHFFAHSLSLLLSFMSHNQVSFFIKSRTNFSYFVELLTCLFVVACLQANIVFPGALILMSKRT